MLLDWWQSTDRLKLLFAIIQYGDGFPAGSPDGHDPLKIARQLAAAGIPLFMVACEPALSGYTYAADFYQALVQITGAQLLPLTSASLLAHVIIGAAGEAMDLDRLHREVGDAVAERLRTMSLESSSGGDIMDEVTRELHQSLRLRNESTKQLYIESIYRESEGVYDLPRSSQTELTMLRPPLFSFSFKTQHRCMDEITGPWHGSTAPEASRWLSIERQIPPNESCIILIQDIL
jgi:hypothetical protein